METINYEEKNTIFKCNDSIKFFNVEKEIRKKINLIKETFVEFYGEEYRNKIEEKLDNIFILSLISPVGLDHYIFKTKISIIDKNINPFLTNLNSSKETEIKAVIYCETYNFSMLEICTLFNDYFSKEYNKIQNSHYPQFIKKRKMYKIITNTKKSFDSIIRKTQKELQEVKQFQNSIEKLIEHLDKKYLKNFIEEIKNILTNEEYKKIENYLISCKNLIEAINICYKYLSKEKYKNIYNSIYKKNKGNQAIEFNQGLTGINVKQEKEKIPFLDPHEIYKMAAETPNHITIPNYIEKKEKITLYSIIMYNFDFIDIINNNSIDSSIIHELNHCLEREIIEENEKRIVIKGDWTYLNYLKQDDNTIICENDEIKYNSIIFSEIINDLISRDITKLMHTNGIYILDNEDIEDLYEDKKEKYNNDDYQIIRFIVEQFYIKYKDIIIKGRIDDIKILEDKVGEKNLTDLGNLIEEAYNLSKEELENKREYYKNESNKILNRMENYNKSKVKKI